MNKTNCISFLLFVSLLSLLSQPSEITTFEIKKSTLENVEYPWGPELRLTLSGRARSILSESCLLVTIFYNDVKIKQLDLRLGKSKEGETAIEFEKYWEPLHSAYQIAPFGYYDIFITLSIQEQKQEIIQRWRSRYHDKIPNSFQSKILYGTQKAVEKQRQEYKLFYIQTMKNLNEVYRELHQKTQEAKRQKPFQPHIWLGWFQGSFLDAMEVERVKLERHKSKYFALIYPKTFDAMYEYVDVLIRLARFNAIHIYQHHGRDRDIQHLKNLEFFGMKTYREFIFCIQNLHSISANELGIFLRKELGYLPPPGRY